ncbi:MAG: hypothetical protein ACYSWO_11515 [Planctomycetota bacterium]|jgi:hypothetical protein
MLKKKVSKKKIVGSSTGKKVSAVPGPTKKTKKVAKKKARKKRTAKKPEGTCFVMMPFRDPFGLYYRTIFIPAIKAAKLEPVRADDLFRPSPIVADIWKMVQDADVLLAELTTKNANVFYELGLAHAIGKPVVLVSEEMDDVPFDLQQLRVLNYNKEDPIWGPKLSKSITQSLKETLDSPVEAVPNIFRKKVESKAPKQDAALARIEALEQQMRSLRTRSSTEAKPSMSHPDLFASLAQAANLKSEPLLRRTLGQCRMLGIPPSDVLAYLKSTLGRAYDMSGITKFVRNTYEGPSQLHLEL